MNVLNILTNFGPHLRPLNLQNWPQSAVTRSSMVDENPPNVIFCQSPVLEIGAFEVLVAVWALVAAIVVELVAVAIIYG